MGEVVIKDILHGYKGKKVFLTGDTGFKGAWLCAWLLELGAEVVGYALPPKEENDLFNALNLKDKIKHIDGDIRDLESLSAAISDFQPEFVFHLAAQALVRDSYDDPKETFDTNVGGSVNLLEAVRKCSSVKSLVYVTSDKCYKNKEWVWGYRENEEMGGHDPYSASKGAAELLFSSYADSFFSKQEDFGYVTVRAGNVIGGGDWAKDRIVPDCVRALLTDTEIEIRKPNATRPWQHVLEPLSGYLLTGLKIRENSKLYSGAWNFGPSSSAVKTVGTLAKEITDIWGSGAIKIAQTDDGLHEANLLHLNCDKAHHLLEWFPAWDFDKAVGNTIQWYIDVSRDGKSAEDVTRAQILNYMES